MKLVEISQPKHLISKVLSPAVRLWLRSQLQQVSELLVQISGSDRQILKGYIPQVSVYACHAVYQGLHLTRIQIVGENIKVNLAALLKGQPLRLLEPVPVWCDLLLEELDLTASLESPLLISALTDLLSPIVAAEESITWQKISIENGQLVISAALNVTKKQPKSMLMRTRIRLTSSHELQLEAPEIQIDSSVRNLESLCVDLGSEVELSEIALSSGQIVCKGRIMILP